MLYNFFFALILICFTSNHILAQQAMTDVVHLKDGTIIHGQVLKYDPQGKIRIEAEGGSIVVYESSRVLKIKKERTMAPSKKEWKERSLHIKENKCYHSFAIGNVIPTFIAPSRFGPSPLDLLGLQLEYSVGYQLNQYFGLGLNVGFFGAGSDGTIPISANFRGYFMKTSASLYYDLNVGYGFSINSFTMLSDNGNGGLHVHPSIGIRFASTRKGHTTLGLGSMVQMGRRDGFESENRTLFAITLRVGATF